MNKFNSIFGQLLTLFPRVQFEQFTVKTKANKGIKGFPCWDHFVSMLFCQLGQAHSLREICGGLSTALGRVVHLGIKAAPKRSTLAYANEHRSWELYKLLFFHLLEICQTQFGSKHKFRFKNKLLSFDASLISLCATMFEWAKYRQTKGAIKLHLLLDHAGYLPVFINITEGRKHEVKVFKTLTFDPGTIIVFDRGLIDYTLWGRWCANGLFFVTRLKDNADFKVIENRQVPRNRNIRLDQVIKLDGFYSKEKCPYLLRRIQVWVDEKKEIIDFITNQLDFGATTIANIYKDRWQIEMFFKALKQNLHVKTFVGTSANAVMIQIWTALIAILILKYLKAKSKLKWSLSNLAAMLRMNLLVYKELWNWLDQPYYSSPPRPIAQQLAMAL